MVDIPKLARRMAEECPAFRVRQASRVLAKLYDDELRPLGLQLSQLPVLGAVAFFAGAGASMSTLAQAVVMDRTTLTRNIRPLERAGHLRVARSRDDARTRVVFLTRAGERMIESVFPVWERVLKRIRTTLGADALAALHASMDQVIALSPVVAEGGSRSGLVPRVGGSVRKRRR